MSIIPARFLQVLLLSIFSLAERFVTSNYTLVGIINAFSPNCINITCEALFLLFIICTKLLRINKKVRQPK